MTTDPATTESPAAEDPAPAPKIPPPGTFDWLEVDDLDECIAGNDDCMLRFTNGTTPRGIVLQRAHELIHEHCYNTNVVADREARLAEAIERRDAVAADRDALLAAVRDGDALQASPVPARPAGAKPDEQAGDPGKDRS